MCAQKLFQRNCIVVLRIVRAVYQGYGSVVRRLYDRSPYVGISREFSEIAAAKLVPLSWIMVEPLPEFGAWSHILGPTTNFQRRLFYASRPQPLDEQPRTVGAAHCFVHTLCIDHRKFPLLTRRSK